MTDRFANREVCDMIIYDFRTQKPILRCDYANTNTTELTGEVVYAYGGQGHPKRVAFNGEKGGTFTFETQIQSFALYSIMTGAGIDSAANIVKREVVTCSTAGSLTLSAAAVAGTLNVFAEADDCGTALTATVSGTAVTCSSAAANSKYICYYQTAVSTGVKKLSIKSTVFPKAIRVVADTFEKTEADEILPYQMVVYKAQPQTNITLSNSNSGDPVTLTVTCDLMADVNNNMIDLILQDEPAS